MKMNVVCLFGFCAMAQSQSFWSSFIKSPMRHLGLEPSSERPRGSFKSEFLGSSAIKKSQTVDVSSDLGVKADIANSTKFEKAMQVNATVTQLNATVVSAASIAKIEPKIEPKLMREETKPVSAALEASKEKVSTSPVPKAEPKVTNEEVKPSSPEAAASKEKVATSTSPSESASRRAERSFEGNLIHSLRFMGDNGEEAVECVTHCRYGESVRHPWRECLERCVENRLMRSTFMSMLPQEKHDAHASHVEMPDVLKKRQQRKSQRSAEL
jgi:hypothetical protein